MQFCDFLICTTFTQIMPFGIITAFAVIKVITSIVNNSKKGFIELNLQLILNPYAPIKAKD